MLSSQLSDASARLFPTAYLLVLNAVHTVCPNTLCK